MCRTVPQCVRARCRRIVHAPSLACDVIVIKFEYGPAIAFIPLQISEMFDNNKALYL